MIIYWFSQYPISHSEYEYDSHSVFIPLNYMPQEILLQWLMFLYVHQVNLLTVLLIYFLCREHAVHFQLMQLSLVQELVNFDW